MFPVKHSTKNDIRRLVWVTFGEGKTENSRKAKNRKESSCKAKSSQLKEIFVQGRKEFIHHKGDGKHFVQDKPLPPRRYSKRSDP